MAVKKEKKPKTWSELNDALMDAQQAVHSYKIAKLREEGPPDLGVYRAWARKWFWAEDACKANEPGNPLFEAAYALKSQLGDRRAEWMSAGFPDPKLS